MMIDSIIFDLDGTLWDASEQVCIAWNSILNNYPNIKKVITAEDLAGCFGLPLGQVTEKLFPEQDEGFRAELLEQFGVSEIACLSEHGGRLYPDLEETLAKLSEKLKLFIVSNCQDGYIQAFYKAHKLERNFTDIECEGVTRLSKGENIRLVIHRNHLKDPVYVGDTSGDEEAAKAAGIPFVYARYGFGQVEKYDYVIDHFEDLCQLPILENL